MRTAQSSTGASSSEGVVDVESATPATEAIRTTCMTCTLRLPLAPATRPVSHLAHCLRPHCRRFVQGDSVGRMVRTWTLPTRVLASSRSMATASTMTWWWKRVVFAPGRRDHPNRIATSMATRRCLPTRVSLGRRHDWWWEPEQAASFQSCLSCGRRRRFEGSSWLPCLHRRRAGCFALSTGAKSTRSCTSPVSRLQPSCLSHSSGIELGPGSGGDERTVRLSVGSNR